MKVLRIKAYQETACYTKPFANKVTETYPLPPYATVKGLIHAVMKADRLLPFSLSIQGDYETQIVDYRKTYFVKKHEFAMPIILDGIQGSAPAYDANTMSSMPLYTHMLYNVELVFHIKAEEALLDNIYKSFQNSETHLSLGRHEDLLRLNEVGFADLEEVEGCETRHSMYVPKQVFSENGNGIPYLLNWTYRIKKGIREWKRIPTLFISAQNDFSDDELNVPLYVDNENYPVIWNI
jgi:CRISPR-associated protein Cas5t